ncbi:cell division protein ZipA [Allostella sp. ATCC 35155]|nr:cell division protein ZipA [Stella sp. ATCC 35155]
MAILFLICGRIAAGKSTLARQLADRPATLLVSQDRLMAALYPGEIGTMDDYARVAPRLRTAIEPLLVDMLRSGVSVVLDWPANTVRVRAWMRSILVASDADHELHLLEPEDGERRRRLSRRNASGAHEYAVDDATLALFDRHFEPPAPEEGFRIVRHG